MNKDAPQPSEPTGVWFIVLTVFMPDYVAWHRRTNGPEWTRERGPVFNVIERRHEMIRRDDGIYVLGDVTDTRTRLVVFLNGQGGEVGYEPGSDEDEPDTYDHLRFAHRDDVSPNEDPDGYTVPYAQRHGYDDEKETARDRT